MSSFRKIIRCNRGQALIEFAVILPLLIVLCFGVVEFANMISAYLVLTHLSSEGANLVAREAGAKGSSTWTTKINSDLGLIVKAASPVIKSTNRDQWKVIYTEVVWDSTQPACTAGGNLANGSADYYRIKRSNVGWTDAVTWNYGGLSQSSKIGTDPGTQSSGDCASASTTDTNWNASIKALTTTGLTFHVVEVFYDYAPSKLTPVQNFIGGFVPGIFYSKSVYMDVAGG
jgi:Flp pilus assembly protein TadG